MVNGLSSASGRKRYEKQQDTLLEEVRGAVGRMHAELRTKFARPPEEVPHQQVLIRVGDLVKILTLSRTLADRYGAGVRTIINAAVKRENAAIELARAQRDVRKWRNRAESAEAELRRLRQARA